MVDLKIIGVGIAFLFAIIALSAVTLYLSFRIKETFKDDRSVGKQIVKIGFILGILFLAGGLFFFMAQGLQQHPVSYNQNNPMGVHIPNLTQAPSYNNSGYNPEQSNISDHIVQNGYPMFSRMPEPATIATIVHGPDTNNSSAINNSTVQPKPTVWGYYYNPDQRTNTVGESPVINTTEVNITSIPITTVTVIPAITVTLTATLTPTPIPTPSPTSTVTPTPNISTPIPTIIPTINATQIPTTIPTPTPIPTVTIKPTPKINITAIQTPAPTATPKVTATPNMTQTPTVTIIGAVTATLSKGNL